MSAVEGRAMMLAETHQAEGMGCSCGFCVWSVEHVVIMVLRDLMEQGQLERPAHRVRPDRRAS